MTVTALETGDQREVEVEVAGPAALLVAKAHKIHDRLRSGRDDRVVDKDAADAYRLMQTTSPLTTGERLAELRVDERDGDVTAEALG
jgi:hypothetical protein